MRADSIIYQDALAVLNEEVIFNMTGFRANSVISENNYMSKIAWQNIQKLAIRAGKTATSLWGRAVENHRE